MIACLWGRTERPDISDTSTLAGLLIVNFGSLLHHCCRLLLSEEEIIFGSHFVLSLGVECQRYLMRSIPHFLPLVASWGHFMCSYHGNASGGKHLKSGRLTVLSGRNGSINKKPRGLV